MATHPLMLFNSLGREVEEFRPIEPGRVRLYTCGLTVYDYAHVGNLRAYLFTDTLRRVLELKGYDVLHVMNITDVGHLTSDADEGEDKMELAAGRRGKSVWDIAEHYTQAFREDLAALNILSPSVWSRATDHIQEMIDFARRIEENGYGYVLEDGLYLDTSKVTDYGRLGLLDLEGQQEGARVEARAGKRNPADFVVWRRSPVEGKRLMEWHSPWGVGVPGWHLECSVMSVKYLGAPFDIHTGGIDHRQVHHVNEIAQNEAFLGAGRHAVNYWIHNDFLTFGDESEKMSKSTGHFLRLKDLVEWGIHPLSYRFFVLQAVYRRPLEFSFEALVAARNGLLRLLRRVQALKAEAGECSFMDVWSEHRASRGGSLAYVREQLTQPLGEKEATYLDEMDAALSRDLATPEVLSLLSRLVTDRSVKAEAVLRLVAVADLALGLDLLTTRPEELNLRPRATAVAKGEVKDLLAERERLRKERDFKAADEIRDRLTDLGVALLDSPEGTTWEWIPRRPE